MRHRPPEPTPPPVSAQPALAAITRLSIILATGNALVGTTLIVATPGPAPSLTFLRIIAPLPAFGVGFVLVAAGMLLAGHRHVRLHVAAHFLAVVLWLMYATGAVLGLVLGSTQSPASSTVLTVLTIMTASYHLNGLLFRRRIARSGQ